MNATLLTPAVRAAIRRTFGPGAPFRSDFTATIQALQTNAAEHARGSEYDAAFDAGEFSGPAHANAQQVEAAAILARNGWTTAGLEVEARRRGLRDRWLYHELGGCLPSGEYDECGYFRNAVDGGPVYFVAAYRIARCYGGPEEGGWWYDTGEPTACIVACTEADAERAAAELRRRYPTTKRRYSVNGGDDWDVRTSHTPPVAFPAVRPHYE